MNKVFISCKESRIENNKSFYGCFYLGPFNESESLTIANALRRTLLSECPGLAIISVLIENVNHEYSTLTGVRDSVLDILLNLKEIVLKKSKNPWLTYKRTGVSSVYDKVGSSYFKPVVGYLKVKGPGIVRAKDLRLPPFIQCVDPEQYIATLSENGSLNMKFVIMEGKNYIIQKSNSFVDYSLVKKRRTLFKQLKEVMMKSTWTAIPKDKYNTIGLKEAVNDQLLNSSGSALSSLSFGSQTSLQVDGTIQNTTDNKSTSKHLKSPPQKNRHETKTSDSGFVNTGENHFYNASPLNIDAVFSPIKKVNYIIELSANKIVNNSNNKYSFMDNISDLMQSGEFYKKNFPFLTRTYSSLAANLSVSTPSMSHSSRDGSKKIDGKTSENTNVMKDLLEYIETYSTDELWSASRSLHPLRKEGVLHTIILEIWTNGSLHPREALTMAFSHLSSLFLNLEKTRIFNPIYKNVSSYKKSLNSIQHFDAYDILNTSSFDPDEMEQNGLNPVTNETKMNKLSSKNSIVNKNVSSNKATGMEKIEKTKNLDISKLNLNLRTYTQLKRGNIKTIGDLLTLSPKTLVNNFKVDQKSITGIIKSLDEFGFSLALN